MEGHRIGRRFGRVGNGNYDRVFVDFDQFPLFGFQFGQFLAQFGSRKVHAPIVQTAGDIGKVNPLEEAVSLSGIFGVLLDFDFTVDDRNRVSRFERFNFAAIESQIQQRHAFAGRRKQRTSDRIAHRLDAQRITSHQHFAFGVHVRQRPRSIESLGNVADHVDQRDIGIRHQLFGKLMHQDFGVRVSHEMVVRFAQKFLSQFGVVGQLSVESKRKPLPLIEVMILERLRVAFVVGAAGGVTDVPDRNRATVLLHQIGGFGFVRESEDFLDTAKLAVGVDQLPVLCFRMVAGDTG